MVKYGESATDGGRAEHNIGHSHNTGLGVPYAATMLGMK